MNRGTHRLFIASGAMLFVACASAIVQCAPAGAPIQFDRQVMPILSDNCYFCHGPDEKARKAHLRFDTQAGAFRLKDGKSVIVPGRSGDSEIIRRITSSDPDVKMPPPKSNRKLSQVQIEAVRQWVDQGAKWGVHWAFVPPVKAPLPPVANADWCRRPIDRYVRANLEKQQMNPAPPADKATLLRRVSLDLTGLPPTPVELDAFLNDHSENAYEKVVDRLLASPRYGERMASDWLDIARYADTHGYQADRYRAMWPYRDWVIKAFNENLPFDKFITWQLAGDLLPNATKEQRLATAFNRLHMQNEEGGIVEEEFRVAYVVDRVDTFGTAFLGLTFECCRCHDHKFDPIRQKEFYSLFSFFQNVDESGQTAFFTSPMAVPTLILSTDAQDAKLAQLGKDIEQKQQQITAARGQAADESFATWLKERPAEFAIPGEVAAYSFDSIQNNQIANSIDPKKPGKAVEGPKIVPGKIGNGAMLSGDNGFVFPGVGHFTRCDPFSLAIWVNAPALSPRMVVLHHSKAPIDAGSRGYELLLEDGHVAFGLHHMWPGNSLKVRTKNAITTNQWTHLAATYDGSSRAAGVAIYIDGAAQPLEVIRDGLYKDITYAAGEPDLAIGYRFRDSGFKDGKVDEFRVFNRALTLLEAAKAAGKPSSDEIWAADPAKLAPDAQAALRDYYLANAFEPAVRLTRELHALRKQENDVINPIPEVMVMQEMAHPKPAFVLKRGAYDARGEQVFAATPAVLPPFPKDQPRNRLGLARWLLDPANPLTARVIVNRAWQQMFGKGIVETSDNFGSQGSPPSQPQVLDWLAVDFRENGWDMKRLLKTIALSATYRQSSKCPRELLEKDPGNQLLARGPSRRLTAEMLRDQALFDAGLLAEKQGGPSVKPYQPDGLWDVAMGGPHYDQGHGDDLHRRSLYTFWKRTVPPPAMMTFDAADRSYCVARRQSTSTPLQALTLLNDVQITEAARLISQRAMKEGGATVEDRAAWIYRLITDHTPTPAELAVLNQLYDEQRAVFAADPASAAKLLAVGEAKNDPALDKLDLAAGAVLAEALLNHDAAMMRR
ncbi:MAG TPA: DUF1553 domain-containing protein [Tepidisphaeraceae bacterium]|nr:DUF1553 domain-containing protein [Tepidisphaeraceae bacterium]